ncbi:2-C-methyl-D-erythritol 4-phosphate cytidylyltransferase [Amycolatopsis sp. NPDC059657]|uniref:2-C-methyl-D-erythritol 4-phosphate cytidylyltransferase n=1 Tax=Amycolatopsis sp. NPDC059657 TaxID=3346899 RepID=UPI00366E54C0
MKTIAAIVDAVAHVTGETDVLSPVHGEPILTHAVRGLLDTGHVDSVVVVAPARRVVMFRDALSGLDCRVAPGSVPDAIEPGHDVYLVHDPLRAFTPASVIEAVAAAVGAESPAVVPVLPMSDTVKAVGASNVIISTLDRSLLRSAQTPAGFTEEALRAAYATGEFALPSGARTVPGHPDAMRVATPFELRLAEALLAAGSQENTL